MWKGLKEWVGLRVLEWRMWEGRSRIKNMEVKDKNEECEKEGVG